MTDCPIEWCDESYGYLPDLKDHLIADHKRSAVQAKRLAFGTENENE